MKINGHRLHLRVDQSIPQNHGVTIDAGFRMLLDAASVERKAVASMREIHCQPSILPTMAGNASVFWRGVLLAGVAL